MRKDPRRDEKDQSDYARYAGPAADWEQVRSATRAAWDRVDARVQSATGN